MNEFGSVAKSETKAAAPARSVETGIRSLAGIRKEAGSQASRATESVRVSPEHVRVVDEATRQASAEGTVKEVRDAVRPLVEQDATLDRAFDAVADRPGEHSFAKLGKALLGRGVIDEARFTSTLRSFEIDGRAVEVVVAKEATGTTRTWWHAAPDGDIDERKGVSKDRGSVRLVAVGGAQVGDDNVQVNLHVREIEDPKIDFNSLMGDSPVAEALGRLSAAPQDAALRRAAVAALERVPGPTSDWTEAFAGNGSASLGAGAARLDGTVAIVHSRCVQVGDRQHQENTILHTVSPEIAAGALLANPEMVQRIIDVACSPGDTSALAALERTTSMALVGELLDSSAARQGHGAVYRPPAAGRTLQIKNATGVSVGERASQRTDFAQRAHLGRAARTSMNRFTSAAREAGRDSVQEHRPNDQWSFQRAGAALDALMTSWKKRGHGRR